eukprot:3778551-Heterocapsa_arctica.AAC.1
MGIDKTMCLRLQIGLSSSAFMQNDKRSARILMVIAIYVFLSVSYRRQSDVSADGKNKFGA